MGIDDHWTFMRDFNRMAHQFSIYFNPTDILLERQNSYLLRQQEELLGLSYGLNKAFNNQEKMLLQLRPRGTDWRVLQRDFDSRINSLLGMVGGHLQHSIISLNEQWSSVIRDVDCSTTIINPAGI